MQMPGLGQTWLSGDAGTLNVNDPVFNSIIPVVDDWLAPSFNVSQHGDLDNEFVPLDVYTEKVLEITPQSPLPMSDDELDNFFEQPTQRVGMRAAFSMNDLQSLQSCATTTSAPVWHRSASIKPSLESVPEGGPPQLGELVPLGGSLFQPGDFSAATMFNDDELDFLVSGDAATAVDILTASPQQHPQAYHFNNPSLGNNYGGMVGTTQTGPLHQGFAHETVQTAPLHSMQGSVRSLGIMMPPMSAMQKPTLLQPLGFLPTHPESSGHSMLETVKQEPLLGFETGSSGMVESQQRLQPSGAAMRKSHSALELGAWRKIAAGDMDFVDPNGSVREKLQGLDFSHHFGKLTPEERLQKILRYRAKKQMRNFNRTIKYQCRKSLADTRPRVRGRFARDNEPGSVMPHETKKALKEGNSGSSPPQAEQECSTGVAVKMEEDCATAGEAQNLHTGAASCSNSIVPSISGEAGLVENHEHGTVALANLYNQWSEADMNLHHPKGPTTSNNSV